MTTFPKTLTVGSVSTEVCARDHALCDGPSAVAHVLGAGYLTGRGYSPETAALAAEIARRWNLVSEQEASI